MKKGFNDIINNIDDGQLDKLMEHLMVEGKSVSPFKSLKQKSLSRLQEVGLPDKKNEEYKYTFLKRTFDQIANDNVNLFQSFNNSNLDFLDRNLDYAVDESIEIFFIDGHPRVDKEGMPKGVSISFFSELSQKEQEKIGHIYENEDEFYLLNTLLFTNGIYVKVDDNVQLTKPILVTYIHNGNSLAFPRLFFDIGKSAKVSVIERYKILSTAQTIHCPVSESFVHDNGQLNVYKLQCDLSTTFSLIDNPIVVQEKDTVLSTYVFTTGGHTIRNNPVIDLLNENCETNMYGFYFVTGTSHIDNHSTINHKFPHCNSNQLYKGIIQEQGTGVFNGKIYVEPEAQKTNAFQSNKNIMLSKEANIYTKPQLEIYADDVKCSHGCTLGELEEEHMFYLRARGLSKGEARALLIKAYASAVITLFPQSLQDHLDCQLRSKLLIEKTASTQQKRIR